jgi:hypothetical protein
MQWPYACLYVAAGVVIGHYGPHLYRSAALSYRRWRTEHYRVVSPPHLTPNPFAARARIQLKLASLCGVGFRL